MISKILDFSYLNHLLYQLVYSKFLYYIRTLSDTNTMMFEWEGLSPHRYFILSQKPNPLKYCNYALPFPLGIGLPFMPCDLPNQYQLYATNEDYSLIGEIFLIFQEEISLLERILIPASHRPWIMEGRDYYNEVPYRSSRNFNICCSPHDRPEVRVYLQDKMIGWVRERTILNCCCITQIFQQFEIFNEHGQLQYRVQSKNPQRGHFIILPFWGFDKIRYNILQIQWNKSEQLQEEEEEIIEKQTKVGEIVHLFNGISEYTSKNDKYGISLPENSTQEQKCLLIHAVLLMDYLLFQNF